LIVQLKECIALSWILSNFEDLMWGGGGEKKKERPGLAIYHLMDDHHFNHITKLREKKGKKGKKLYIYIYIYIYIDVHVQTLLHSISSLESFQNIICKPLKCWRWSYSNIPHQITKQENSNSALTIIRK
jgi:hypothetical protein